MARLERVSIDVSDVALLHPDGGELPLDQIPGLWVVVLMRHRHCLPCQQHLVQVQEALDDPWVDLIMVGFSPPDRLVALARHLGWAGMVLSDPLRQLYRRLGLGRAPWWRKYTPATVALYVRAVRGGQKLQKPVEDTRQLGGDALLHAGKVTHLWRSRTPDDRPPPGEVMAAARAVTHREQ